MAKNAAAVETAQTKIPDASPEALEAAGYAKKQMLTTGMTTQVLGISPDQLRRLGLSPDTTYANDYRRTCSLYRTETVLELYDAAVVVGANGHEELEQRLPPGRWGSPRPSRTTWLATSAARPSRRPHVRAEVRRPGVVAEQRGDIAP